MERRGASSLTSSSVAPKAAVAPSSSWCAVMSGPATYAAPTSATATEEHSMGAGLHMRTMICMTAVRYESGSGGNRAFASALLVEPVMPPSVNTSGKKYRSAR